MAINIPKANVYSLVQQARSVNPRRFEDMTDFEVYQDMKVNTPEYSFAQGYPEEMYHEHKVKRQLPMGLRQEDIPNPDADYKSDEPTEWGERGSASDLGAMYFKYGSIGATEWAPDWLRNPLRQGANESLTGLAVHIMSGKAPFDIDEHYEPNMFQNALSLAASLVADWYFFSNPATGFSKAGSMFATTEVRKQAAKKLSLHFMGKQAEKGLTKLGLESGEAAVKVAKAMEKASTGIYKTGPKAGKTYTRNLNPVNQSKAFGEELKALGIKGVDDALVSSWATGGLKAAEKSVLRNLGKPDWFRAGAKFIDPWTGKSTRYLAKPVLRDLFHRGGFHTAKQLGFYNAVTNWEKQITHNIAEMTNPETGQPFGELAPNIFERWRSGQSGPIDEFFRGIDFGEVAYSATHGFFGGYAIGGLGMVSAAGAAGAYTLGKGGFANWMTKHPKFEERVTSGLGKYATMVPAEALGFEAGRLITDLAYYNVGKPLGWELPHHRKGTPEYDPRAWYKRVPEGLLQGIITIGGLKMFSGGFKQIRRLKDSELEKYGEKLHEEHTKKTKEKIRIARENAEGTDVDKIVDAIVNEHSTGSINIKNRLNKLKSHYNQLGELNKKLLDGTATDADLEKFILLRERYKNSIDDIAKDFPDAAREIEKSFLKNPKKYPFFNQFSGKGEPGEKEWTEKVKQINEYRANLILKQERKIEVEQKRQDFTGKKLKKGDKISITKELEDGSLEVSEGTYERTNKDGEHIYIDSKGNSVSALKGEVEFKASPKGKEKVITIKETGEKVSSNSASFRRKIYSREELENEAERHLVQFDKKTTTEELRRKLDNRLDQIEESDIALKNMVEKTLQEQRTGPDAPEVLAFENLVKSLATPDAPYSVETRNKIIAVTNKIADVDPETGMILRRYVNSMISGKEKPFNSGVRVMLTLLENLPSNETIHNISMKTVSKYMKGEFGNRNGKHFSQGEVQAVKSVIDFLREAGFYKGKIKIKNFEQQLKQMGWNPKVGETIPPLNSTEHKSLLKNIKAGISAIIKKTTDRWQYSKNMSLSANAGLILQKLMMLGHRQVGIHGISEGQYPIRIQDIVKDGKSYIINVREKGRSGPRDFVRIENKKMEDGVNYYDVLTELIKEAKDVHAIEKQKALNSKKPISVQDKAWIDDVNKFPLITKSVGGKTSLLKNKDISMFMNYLVTNKPQSEVSIRGNPLHTKIRSTLANNLKKVISKLKLSTTENNRWTQLIDNVLMKHSFKQVKDVEQPSAASYQKLTDRQKQDVLRLFEDLLYTFNEKPNVAEYNKVIAKHLKNNEALRDALLRNPVKEQKISIVSGQKPATKQDLMRQLLRYRKRHPGYRIFLDESGKPKGYAANILNQTIELVLGKASLTSYFHEVLHDYHSMVFESKNPGLMRLWKKGERIVENYAKKSDSERWKVFKKEYGNKAAFEYLTQMGAEWALKRSKAMDPHGRFIDKITYWVENLYRKAKSVFGFQNERDIARIFGEKIEIGWEKPLESKVEPLLSDRILKSVGSVLKHDDFFGPGRIVVRKDGGGFKKGDLILKKGFTGKETPMRFEKSNMGSDLLSEAEAKHFKEELKKAGFIKNIDKLTKDEKELLLLLSKRLKWESIDLDLLTKDEANAITNMLWSMNIDMTEGASPSLKKNKTWMGLRWKIKDLDIKHGIDSDGHMAILKALGVASGSTTTASKMQMMRYIEMVSKWSKKDYTEDSFELLSDTMKKEIADNSERMNKFLNSAHGKFIMSTDYVLRKFGARETANAMQEHFRYETIWAGEGHFAVGKAKRILQKHYGPITLEGTTLRWVKGMDSLIYTLDPYRVEGAPLDKFQLNFIEQAKVKGTPEQLATAEIRKFLDNYYLQLEHIAREKIKNPKLLEDWLEGHKQKYVEDYFTKIPTEEGKNYILRNEGSVIKNIREKIVKDKLGQISRKIKELEGLKQDLILSGKPRPDRLAQEKELDLKLKKFQDAALRVADQGMDVSTELGKRIDGHAHRQYQGMISQQTKKVNNPYLLERVATIDNFVKDPSKEGKMIKIWDDNFERVMGQYIRTFSKYLATAKHFTEFTDVYTPYSQEAGKMNEWLQNLESSGQEKGAFIGKALRRRIGMDPRDLEGTSLYNTMSRLGKYSAVFGLSSGFSGLKNLTIGTAMTIGIFGFNNYLRGVTKILSPFNPEAKEMRQYFKKLGLPQVGTKELEITGPIAFWMKFASWMTPTEAANRMVGSYSGLLYAETLVDRLQGKTWLPKDWSKKRAIEELKEKFELTKAEIHDLEIHGIRRNGSLLEPGSLKTRVGNTVNDIRDKILHYGQIITQGSTAESYLPLWWGNENVQAATLFYRMAYSGTYNVMKHIYKPIMKRGDLLPLIRHTFAGAVGGQALWSLYSAVMGQESPKEQEWDKLKQGVKDRDPKQVAANLLPVMFQNVWKNETLGLLTFGISPHGNYKNLPWSWLDNLQQDSIMMPAVARNAVTAGFLVYNFAGAAIQGSILRPLGLSDKRWHNNLPSILDSSLKETVVAWNHMYRFLQKRNTPYQSDYKKLKSWRHSFLVDSGYWHKENKNNPQSRASQKFVKTEQKWMYDMITEAFNAGDYEQAAKFYMATKYYLYDHYREIDGRLDLYHNTVEKRVRNAMKGFLRHLNPLHFPDDLGDRAVPKRVQFKKYLTEENYALAKKFKAQYWWRRRQLDKQIKIYAKIHGDLWKKGYRQDLLPVPPSYKMGGIKGKWWKNQEKIKSRNWSVFRKQQEESGL